MADTQPKMTAQNPVLCGPLLRYTYIDYSTLRWNGSILLVLHGSEAPTLHIQPALDESPSATSLLSENGHSFWRFSISIPLSDEDVRVSYKLSIPASSGGSSKEKEEFGQHDKEYAFYVPAKDETMRIMFHSCNGFSLNVKDGTFAGPVLWKDVLRVHAEQPLHVMIGGGDQVYSDAVRTEGPLQGWADTNSPRWKAKMPLSPQLEAELDNWYFKNYCGWYSKEPFCEAAAIIPSLQIFDDHDIIDGFGSYQDKWMKAPIFLGIGSVAWKYYMLFQQHTPPKGEANEDPSWVIGKEKGPYIQEYSRSICTTLGERVVFYGLDCRVDRTLERVCYGSTYDLMFDRLKREVVVGRTNHLILLLGVPIAYPRLVWLENLLSAHTVTLIRWLDKLFGVASGAFNKFDGSAELLDDLTDHWCAHTHKPERNAFVQRLQRFAKEKQVRVTILSGDVHLAAIGRFFSKASLGIPQNKDPRYMVNIISSAITNAPPPKAIANMLNKRNKLHHLDEHTDENLMALFYQNPDGKSNAVNRTTLPARNYCIITEHAGLVFANKRKREDTSGVASEVQGKENEGKYGKGGTRDGSDSMDMVVAHRQTGGVDHPSASAPQSGTKRKYALDVCIRAEINPKSAEGRTLAYGFSIPSLEV
ncbi:uncharacterized protein FOMMEDRAFT_131380 [Fomitiporia mediterranea MF3/22]|uniref:uncharacterized protein n=1 Tax=Fomitiporia mediterranea (strain MF3/22) TaxID=694068 RepID=UPI00044081B1|nr:uncharacterized protein FOMMEDRAFT_131380 [Fomitiporia mediterranea MF3/22]EJD06423.1 hypothetical protein FOMMEDRAFT_131380 [Fomitiporia mediterranea MF3/22]